MATTTDLALKEIPAHSPLCNRGDAIRLQWRGTTGLGHVILKIVTTYDVNFGESRVAEEEVARRLTAGRQRAGMFPGKEREQRRTKRILAPFIGANLPTANLTPALEAWLKSRGIIPSYA